MHTKHSIGDSHSFYKWGVPPTLHSGVGESGGAGGWERGLRTVVLSDLRQLFLKEFSK